MHAIRKNVTHKFLFLLIAIGGICAGVLLLIWSVGITSVPTFYLPVLLAPLLFFSFLAFVWVISYPLKRLHNEVSNVMLGKKYQRVPVTSCDEIGMSAHFFNQITKNLEGLSDQIMLQKAIETDMGLAAEIQRDILPTEAPGMPGLEVVAKSKAATSIGGDSFDFIPTEKHGTLIYLGDASGHGVAAGLIMTMVNTLIRTFTLQGLSPVEIISETNKMLHNRLSGKRFMTMAMLRWHPKQKKMHLIGAGHEYVLVYRALRQEVEMIKTGGVALHLLPDISSLLSEQEIKLDDRDVALLYTDGITEGKNHHSEMYGVQRLKNSLERNGHRDTAEEVFTAISDEYAEFVDDSPQEDDVTMMVLRRLAAGEERRHGVQLAVNVAKSKKKRVGAWSWD